MNLQVLIQRCGLDLHSDINTDRSQEHPRFEAGVEYVDEKFVDNTKNDYFNGRAFTEYKYAFSEKSNVSQSLEFNYDFENGDNYDIASVTAVTTALSDMLSLKAGYNINFVNAPVPATLKKTDTTLSVSLIINM